MPEPAYDPAYDESIPYYERTPRDRALRAVTVKFVDSVGTHLICPRKTCNRERGCADRDARNLPFCWRHYRGILRFLFFVVAEARGIEASDSAASDELPMPKPFRGVPLLASWAEAGADIRTLARPAEDGPDDFTWEALPEWVELKSRLVRDWRGSAGRCRGRADPEGWALLETWCARERQRSSFVDPR